MKSKNSGQVIRTVTLLFIMLFIFLPAFSQVRSGDSLGYGKNADIKYLIHENVVSAKRWWYGWLTGYSAATVVQGTIAVTADKKSTRQDMWNGAATTMIGAIGILATPLIPSKESMNRVVITTDDPGHINTDIDYSKAYLKEIARREKFGRSWKVHAVAGVVNISSGLVTWLGFKRTFGDGLVNFAINTVVTEAEIWTQPIRAVRDYENYEKIHSKHFTGPVIPERKWYISAGPCGVDIRLAF
jgi:hypothetical protein